MCVCVCVCVRARVRAHDLTDVVSSLIPQGLLRRPTSTNTSLSTTLIPCPFILKSLCECVWGAMDGAQMPSTLPLRTVCTQIIWTVLMMRDR